MRLSADKDDQIPDDDEPGRPAWTLALADAAFLALLLVLAFWRGAP